MLTPYKLDDLFDFVNGGAWTESEYADEGIHVIKVTNMINGGIEKRDDSFLPGMKYEKYKKHRLFTDDIVVATVGSHPTQQGSVVGRTSRIPEEFNGSFLNQNAVCLRVKRPELVCNKYFYYITKTILFKYHVEGRAKGSANQVRMALGDLKKFTHLFPHIQMQKKIAAILSAYDDLIENNKRRIALLENMAKEIYREWFVRFRFPGYQTAQFEKGIPKGWEPTKFGSFCQFEKGKNPDEVLDVAGDELEFYVNMDTLRGNLNSYAKVQRNSVVCKVGDILMLMDGSRSGLTLKANVDGIVGSTLSVIRVEKYLKNFVYEYLKAMQQEIVFNNTGSAIPHANKDYIKRMMLFIPNNKKLIYEFNKKYEVIFHSIKNLDDQNINLSKTKESLLPRLISGKLSVEDLDIQFPASMISEAETV